MEQSQYRPAFVSGPPPINIQMPQVCLKHEAALDMFHVMSGCLKILREH